MDEATIKALLPIGFLILIIVIILNTLVKNL